MTGPESPIAAHAQARLGALPNVQWTISNDMVMLREGQPQWPFEVPAAIIEQIGRDMAAREPWGNLLTNHQRARPAGERDWMAKAKRGR